MVEERLPPNDSQRSGPERPDRRPSRPAWLDWLVVGLLGLAGVGLEYLRGKWTGQPSPIEPTEPAAPSRAPEGREEELPPEEIHQPEGQVEHPRIHHERSDLSARLVYALLVAATCIAVVHYYLVWQMYWYKAAWQEEQKRPPYPASPLPAERLPAEPRLEQLDRLAGVEVADGYKRLVAKEWLLHRYGRGEERGFVHIPIEQAMQIVAGQLPVHAARPPNLHDQGLVDWGDPNSGRLFRGECP